MSIVPPLAGAGGGALIATRDRAYATRGAAATGAAAAHAAARRATTRMQAARRTRVLAGRAARAAAASVDQDHVGIVGVLEQQPAHPVLPQRAEQLKLVAARHALHA